MEKLESIMKELSQMDMCIPLFRGDVKLKNPRAAELGRRALNQFAGRDRRRDSAGNWQRA